MPHPRKTLFSSLLAALILAGAALAAAPKPKTLEIGRAAPDFNLPATDGKYYSLENFEKAEVLVIVFTCNHCPTAQAYEKRINSLALDYAKKGVALVAITPNDPKAVRLDELGYSDLSDSLEETKIRAKQRNFKFPYLYDGEKQKTSRAYGPVSTPHVFIFDKNRILRYVGRIDDSEKPDRVKSRDARNAVQALLAGEKVPVEQTKTFGCSIKWADKRDSVAKAFETWAKEPVSLRTIDANDVKDLVKNDSKNLRLINVWATWCPPCIIEFPELVATNRMYRGREFEMITISANAPKSEDAVLEFLKKQQASSQNFIFNSEDRYELMAAVDEDWPGGIPYTILVKPGGEIIYRQVGMIEPLELRTAVVEYLGRTYK